MFGDLTRLVQQLLPFAIVNMLSINALTCSRLGSVAKLDSGILGACKVLVSLDEVVAFNIINPAL
jgi:hypothetical protein